MHPEYDEIVEECPRCHGYGFIDIPQPDGSAFGKLCNSCGATGKIVTGYSLRQTSVAPPEGRPATPVAPEAGNAPGDAVAAQDGVSKTLSEDEWSIVVYALRESAQNIEDINGDDPEAHCLRRLADRLEGT